MRSWGVQGRSWGGPGARGVPSGAPGLDFRLPRAPFWVPFWSNFWYVLQYFFEAISGLFFDAVLVAFGCHFGVVLQTFWRPNFDTKGVKFSGASPERTWMPPGSKSLIFIGGLFKIDGRPFHVGVAPGAVLVPKMEPKWKSKSAKKQALTHLGNLSEFRPEKC